jgi:hypothetical protein
MPFSVSFHVSNQTHDRLCAAPSAKEEKTGMRSGEKLIDNSERRKATTDPSTSPLAMKLREAALRMTIHFLLIAFKRLSADAN